MGFYALCRLNDRVPMQNEGVPMEDDGVPMLDDRVPILDDGVPMRCPIARRIVFNLITASI